MTRGVLLFAFNTKQVDYYEMAIATAKRVEHFLKLPVSVVTDSNTILTDYDYTFDRVLIEESDDSNKKNQQVWINKGRFKAYQLSPYDETLLLDTDYLINSDKLSQGFNLCEDVLTPNKTSFLDNPKGIQEEISKLSFNTLWATVIFFKKTQKAKEVFDCMKMVQDNYQHYANVYNFSGGMFRNDYALTIALRIVNGHLDDSKDYLPWNLVHAAKDVKAYKVNDIPFNTEYLMMSRTNEKPTYFFIKDIDFHLLDKENFMELVDV